MGNERSCTTHHGNIQQEFLRDWTTSLAIPLFKSGDINNPSNYRTIMINPFFAKLFDSMVENIISKWAEVKEKRARGQAGFRPKHSTVDHGIDFKKEFDTIPRDKLWHRMEELEIPLHYRVIVHRLYEEVKSKL